MRSDEPFENVMVPVPPQAPSRPLNALDCARADGTGDPADKASVAAAITAESLNARSAMHDPHCAASAFIANARMPEAGQGRQPMPGDMRFVKSAARESALTL